LDSPTANTVHDNSLVAALRNEIVQLKQIATFYQITTVLTSHTNVHSSHINRMNNHLENMNVWKYSAIFSLTHN